MFGTLGDGLFDDSSQLHMIKELEAERILDFDVCNHAVVLTESGKVYAWGWNQYLQVDSMTLVLLLTI